ncbi:MAG: permease [Bdellovibrionales bacterium]
MRLWVGGLFAGLAVWALLYSQLARVSQWLVSLLFSPSDTGALREAVAFFLYDAPKILLLVSLTVFVMGMIRSFFSPARARALLQGKCQAVGNLAAALLGIVTPFCSCSAVSLFIGFVSAGVPLGVTFSFLISAPMVNEVALGLLFGLVGWKIALAYLVFGLAVAVVSGWIIGRLGLEGWLEEWVRKERANLDDKQEGGLTMVDRIRSGLISMRDIVGKVWLWMIVGIAVGAAIHGFAPPGLLASVMGRENWWSVPAAVAIGVPMYSNAAGIVPVVEALLGKGAALGTALAFMMSVVALSLPEMIILRKVMSVKLLAVFIGIVAAGILAVGFLFNAIFA